MKIRCKWWNFNTKIDAKNNAKSGFKDAKNDAKSDVKDAKTTCNKWSKNDGNFDFQFASFFALEKLEKHKKITKSLDANPFFDSSGIQDSLPYVVDMDTSMVHFSMKWSLQDLEFRS